MKTWLKGTTEASALQDAWTRIKAVARTDRETRKAHRAALHAKDGRDWRRPLAWGLLAVAVVWLAVLLLMGRQKISQGLFDLYVGPADK